VSPLIFYRDCINVSRASDNIDKMTIKSHIIPVIALYGYFITVSIYIMPSGLPQPSDVIVALMLYPWAFIYINRTPKSVRPFVLVMLVFIFWIAIVSLVNALYLTRTGTLLPVLWYAYNFFFILGLAALSGSFPYEKYFFILKKVLYFSVAITFSLFLLTFDYGVRPTGPFNNPNQVGYYGLLIFCNIVIASWATNHVSLGCKIILILAALICAMSFSLTATGALAIAVAGFFFLSKRPKLKARTAFSFIFFLLAVSCLTSLFFTSAIGEKVLENWEKRVGKIERKTEDVLTSRGYDRILEYPQYLLFGAAEGETWRYADRATTHELHSTLGTLVFSYGIVGVLLFLLLLGLVLWDAPFGIWLVIAAPLAYGFTHQGMRQPMFWILLFITMYAVKGNRIKAYNTMNADMLAIRDR